MAGVEKRIELLGEARETAWKLYAIGAGRFEASYKAIAESLDKRPDARLMHCMAIVDGVRQPHAFIGLLGVAGVPFPFAVDVVWLDGEAGEVTAVPLPQYSQVLQLDVPTLKYYTRDGARALFAMHGTYGPWESLERGVRQECNN